MKNSKLASVSSPIKIDYFDYPKRFINRINEVYLFHKYRFFVFFLLQSHL